MATQAQIEANRQNSQLSTGPKTEEGREASAQNARTHGIFARILPAEEAEFHALAESIKDAYRPVGGWEHSIVEHISLAYFRLQRLYVHEQRAIGLPQDPGELFTALYRSAAHAEVDDASLGNLPGIIHEAAQVATFKRYVENPAARLVVRYEAMLSRQIQRNLELLQQIQSARYERERAEKSRINNERIAALKRRLGKDAFHEAYYRRDMTLDEVEQMVAQQESQRESNRAQRRAAAKAARAARPRRQLSTLDSQPSTLNTKHSTLNPKHSTLNTKHSTLNRDLASFCKIVESAAKPAAKSEGGPRPGRESES